MLLPSGLSLHISTIQVSLPFACSGQCGSCWAFSATEQLESDYFLKYGQLKALSPQQITSCTTSCLGCGGGNPIDAWQYVNTFGGQDPKADYPCSGVEIESGVLPACTCSPVSSCPALARLPTRYLGAHWPDRLMPVSYTHLTLPTILLV